MTSISIPTAPMRAALHPERRSVLRWSDRDGRLVLAALVQTLVVGATIPLVTSRGVGWAAAAAAILGFSILWGSNTVSHNHLHNPIFRAGWHNRAFSLFLSVLLGVPQGIWRARHLWHHAGEPRRKRPFRVGWQGAAEIAMIGALWILLALAAPRFFFLAYVPGYLLGMGLCLVQGRAEHPRGGGAVSHYGALHNALWFNDGYHVEHHRNPGEHWSRLPSRRLAPSAVGAPLAGDESRWPPLLRFLDDVAPRVNLAQAAALGALEKLVLRSALLRVFVVERHARAIRALLPALGGRSLDRIAVVGGGLFPRTALALRRLLPASRLVIIDASARHIALARGYLAAHGEPLEGIEFVEADFDSSEACRGFDLVVIPLAFVGDRAALYRARGAAPMLIHDWLWRRRGSAGAVVSLALLKRLNLVLPQSKVSLHRTAAFLRLYTLLPHGALNRAAAAMTRARRPRLLVRRAIDTWIRVHGIDLREFEDRPYASVDDFFLRRLRPGARPIGDGIVSPADGRMVDGGPIALDRPMRVKEQRLSMDHVVNGGIHDLPLAAYDGGAYAVVFLTPHGYHRVHMPCAGEIVDCRWIPGRFFPQNEDALRHIPRIYERNERAVIRVRDERGRELLLVMVGASLVGGIHLEGIARDVWARPGAIPIGRRAAKGDEIGHFAFGSTVVVLLPRAARAAPRPSQDSEVRMGETLFDVGA